MTLTFLIDSDLLGQNLQNFTFPVVREIAQDSFEGVIIDHSNQSEEAGKDNLIRIKKVEINTMGYLNVTFNKAFLPLYIKITSADSN